MDTPREIEEMQIRLYQTLSDPEKLRRVQAMNRRVKKATLNRLREQNPTLTNQELNWLLVKEFYGTEFHDRFRSISDAT